MVFRKRVYKKRKGAKYIGVRRRRQRVAYNNFRYDETLGRFVRPNKIYTPLIGAVRGLSYNPQFMKIKRSFQLSGPVGDVGTGDNKFKLADYTLNASTTNVTSYGQLQMTFQIDDIPNVTEFGNLFDQYRIVGVKLVFKYMNGTSYDVINQNNNLPLVTMLIQSDFDDSTAVSANISGWNSILETGRYKMVTFPNNYGNSLKYYLKPRIRIKIPDSSGALNGTLVTNKRWLDGSTELQVPHFGIKGLLQSNPMPEVSEPVEHKIRVFATYYTQWRQRQ